MLPLGGDREHGSHKGYAPGSIVDIFSAVLSGASYVPRYHLFLLMYLYPQHARRWPWLFLGAMRIDAFRPKEYFTADMNNWIKRFRAAKPAPEHEKVLI